MIVRILVESSQGDPGDKGTGKLYYMESQSTVWDGQGGLSSVYIGDRWLEKCRNHPLAF